MSRIWISDLPVATTRHGTTLVVEYHHDRLAVPPKIGAVSGSVEVLQHRIKDQSAATEKKLNELRQHTSSADATDDQAAPDARAIALTQQEIALEQQSDETLTTEASSNRLRRR